MPRRSFYFAEDNSVRFYMRDIVTPDEFYVQPLSYEASAQFSQLRRDLSRFYEDEENRKQLFQDGSDNESTADGKIGRFGVFRRRVFDSNESRMERCVVTGWREAAAAPGRLRGMQRYEAQIRFIDTDKKQWVPATRIWKIERR